MSDNRYERKLYPSSYLEDHLYPRGRDADTPDIMPDVLDSDGNPVSYFDNTRPNGGKRITNERTVVDIGDNPNTNTGDPLRTAFVKINNFIEASYWVNEGINKKMRLMEQNYEAVDSDLSMRIYENDSEIAMLQTYIDGGFF
mgnify:CR=1 FL=1